MSKRGTDILPPNRRAGTSCGRRRIGGRSGWGWGSSRSGWSCSPTGGSLAWLAVTPAEMVPRSTPRHPFRRQCRPVYGAVRLLAHPVRGGGQGVGHELRAFVPVFRRALSGRHRDLRAWANGTRRSATIWSRRWSRSPLGLVLANLVGLPRWLDAGFRVELYIKTGIVLLGATLPFTLILWAGPVAILQAWCSRS